MAACCGHNDIAHCRKYALATKCDYEAKAPRVTSQSKNTKLTKKATEDLWELKVRAAHSQSDEVWSTCLRSNKDTQSDESREATDMIRLPMIRDVY